MVFIRAMLLMVCVSSSYLGHVAAVDQARAVDAAYKLVADMFPESKQMATAQEQVALLATLANDKSVFSLFQDVSYAHDEACDVRLGSLVMQLKWGFAASGDILSPLPTMQLQVKSNAYDGKAATLEGLGLLLAQKGVVAKGMQHEAVASTIAALSKNPLCLVALKVALLFKDHSHDKAFLHSEMANLLMRLSLTKLPASLSNIEKISALLPETLHNRLVTFAPELLDSMDVCWAAMTHNADNPIADLYTIEIIEVKNSKAAEAMKKVIGSYVGSSLIADMKHELAAKGFILLDAATFHGAKKDDPRIFTVTTCSSSGLARLPAAVVTALDAANMHTVVTAAAPDAHYFAFKTLTLSPADTAQAFVVVLMNGARRLLHDRQAYFASHPVAVAAHKKQEEAARMQRAQVAQFLATEDGKRSSKRLDDRIITRLEKNPLSQQNATAGAGKNSAALLATLQQQAKAFRAAGQPVPENITTAINELVMNTAATTDNQAAHNAYFAQCAAAVALKYEEEAALILDALAHAEWKYQHQECARIVDPYVLAAKMGELELKHLAARTYAAWLEQEAARFTTISKQLQKLTNYRYQHKIGVLNSTQEEELAEMAQLEIQVGHLLACQTPATFVESLRRAPTLFDFVKQELFSNHVAYKALQDDLLNQLTLIMQRSPHLQEHLDIYRYAIELFMPTLLPMFDRLVANHHAVL
ncbi:hypothetical protein FJ365_02965 [Candidatus Dependentiae bacterium]|nr:hypothetical protein [Candidatus Dependentiae bacterium]